LDEGITDVIKREVIGMSFLISVIRDLQSAGANGLNNRSQVHGSATMSIHLCVNRRQRVRPIGPELSTRHSPFWPGRGYAVSPIVRFPGLQVIGIVRFRRFPSAAMTSMVRTALGRSTRRRVRVERQILGREGLGEVSDGDVRAGED
jgi:hypothetical protein